MNATEQFIQIVTSDAPAPELSVACHFCWANHPAEYSHEGKFGEGPIYAVVCTGTDEWVTDFYTADALTA